MAEEFQRQSALDPLRLHSRRDHSPPSGRAIAMKQPPRRGQFIIRGPGGDRGFAKAVEAVLGVSPPTKPNTFVSARGIELLWLGPTEWLALVPAARAANVAKALVEALSEMHGALSDVSSSRTVISISGAHARQVLQKGCPIDLHERAFAAGNCAQTTLARCNMLVQQVDKKPTYHVFVARSFAIYAWQWLEDAATEYGVVVPPLSSRA